MKIKLKHAIIFVIVLIAAIAVYSFIPGTPEDTVDPEMIRYDNLEEVVFEVTTSDVIKADLVKSITANGIARAFNELDVIANTSGYINTLSIFEGKDVRKGDLLVSLDDREHRLTLKEAESKLNEAKIQYVLQKREIGEVDYEKDGSKIKNELLNLENNKSNIKEEEYTSQKNKLEGDLILSGSEREKAVENRSGLTSARISYERAMLMLSYTKVSAPFNGLIADVDLAEGKRINSGEKLFRLVDVAKIKIDAGVLENDVPIIEKGTDAEVTFNALPGEQFHGRIIYINPCIDPVTKTCRVTVEILNRNNKIKPGMFASIKLSSQVLKNRVLIPREALVSRDKRNLVFVQEGDLAKWKYIETGEQNDNYIEVLDGVKPGEKVITEGNFNLAHDAKIKIKDS